MKEPDLEVPLADWGLVVRLLAASRRGQKLTQARATELMGRSAQSTLSTMETLAVMPRLDTLDAYARAVNGRVTLSVWLAGSEDTDEPGGRPDGDLRCESDPDPGNVGSNGQHDPASADENFGKG